MDNVNTRREFLQFITSQSAVLSLAPLVSGLSLSGCATDPSRSSASTGIATSFGIKPSLEDKLVLANGLRYNLISKWGDPINNKGETFGFNNDFNCFLPIDGKNDEGLLWVNHESVSPEFIHNKNAKQLTRSAQEMIPEQEAVGGSIIHIKKEKGQWTLQKNSQYNRRLSARTKIPFSHGHKVQGTNTAVGTLANCAGGITPWNTFLTSEENYDMFYGEAYIVDGKRQVKYIDKVDWYKQYPYPPEHYGWVVEIDPWTGKAEKQVLLGRAPHEGATIALTKDNRVVAYMGEDRPNGYIFKFVSTGRNFKAGTLYAADTVNGKWLALDIDKNPKLKKFFKTQLDVLTYSHQAAEIVGATPQDRPEDIQINPATGDVIIAITNNVSKRNFYGSLLKISEQKDHDSLEFQSSTFVSGGLKTGIACPDNLCFDRKGNLWVTVDIDEKSVGKGPYSGFGNNGLFYIPVSGANAGVPVQVASGPVDSELTGPWFSPDHKTLFLSVQHPGCRSCRDITKLTSHWPMGPGEMPRSAVVAIEGELLDRLMS